MPNLFKSQPGVVYAVELDGAATGTVRVVGLEGTDVVLITSIGYSQGVNVQFMQSLEKVVYLYSFGDRMGTVKVSGLLLDRYCDTQGSSQGYAVLAKYYAEKRAISEDRIVQVYIGNDNEIRGFLTDINIQTHNPELRTMAYTLTIATLPEYDSTGAGAGTVAGG